MDTLFHAISGWRWPIAISILFLLLLWESASPYFLFFRTRTDSRLRHGGRNIFLGIFNGLIVAVIFAGLWSLMIGWIDDRGYGLLNLAEIPSWLHVVGAFILLDFWTYWWHRFNHVLPFLWRFHKVHHSDPFMDVTTANRFHLGEIVFSSLLRLPVFFLIGNTLGELALYEIFLFANNQVQHANIGISASGDKILRIFLTSPAMHKVHHSRWLPETNSNYTSLLSVWDRLFRSFRLRADPHEICFGLDDTDQPRQQTIPGLFLMPAEKGIPPITPQKTKTPNIQA